MAIDPQRIVAREMQRASAVKLQRSVREWMNRTYLREEAAVVILRFLLCYTRTGRRYHHRQKWMEPTPSLAFDTEDDGDYEDVFAIFHSSSSSTSFTSTATLSESPNTWPGRSPTSTTQEFEVFLWHGLHLGIEVTRCIITGYPCVSDTARANEALPGTWHVREGDLLIAINDEPVHHANLQFDDVLQILENGVRPAVLRFQRPSHSHYESSPASAPPFVHRKSQRHGSSSTEAASSARLARQHRRERTEASLCYLIWREEDGPLGIHFKESPEQPYLEVLQVSNSGVAARESLSPQVAKGDLLLSINLTDVSSLGSKRVLQVLRYSPRPLVLTFRRARENRSLGSRTFEL
ncbi:hypothetical protein Poli38472_006811 [Pythium oligandrum]|uniref:PDZ domain-containing protein n=1 Tax=Pythium oligandrum TaxID=41045 RepID=A0A8K1C5G5_PYTOL|nr:hypothetical protein Poli38472_006811 [Pythium oligandrum]|eukprot:TMW56801.1 hypothetical protein Poli38472_006811 [Pythium oligandrum]